MPPQRQQTREFAKRLLSLSRVKIVYAKITRTRTTLFYFFITLVSALLLCGLQGLLLYDNTNAVDILRGAIQPAGVPPHITMRVDGELEVCDHIPDNHGTGCVRVLDLVQVEGEGKAVIVGKPLQRRDGHKHDDDDDDGDEEKDWYEYKGRRVRKPHADPAGNGTISLAQQIQGSHSVSCIYSLSYIEENLHDSQREDVATLFFHLWLFTIGLVALLNESLPHLGAAFFGHVLGGAWAASRVQSTKTLVGFYREVIVPGPCKGVDLLGSWWELRLLHTIPVVVANGVSIIALGVLSYLLLKVYHRETLSRVGASPVIHGMYKLVLFFSVGLQLASFFILVSTAIWVVKIARDDFRVFATHAALYFAAFVVVSVMVWPWLVLGWLCVRRECKIRFGVFLGISGLLIAISGVMFSSNLYRCIFMTWQFFATVTVTAFVFLVFTTILGVVCYLNYGKGLKEYLQVTEALEGEDFTPVYFPRTDDGTGPGEPKLVLAYATAAEEKYDLEKSLSPTTVNATASNLYSDATLRPPLTSYASLSLARNNKRGSSVYSDNNISPILLSSSPPLISDLAAPGERVRKTLRKSRMWPGDNHDVSSGSDGESEKSGVSGLSGGIIVVEREREREGGKGGKGGVRDLVDVPRKPGAAHSKEGRESARRIPSFTTASTFRPQLPRMEGTPPSSEEGHGRRPTRPGRPTVDVVPVPKLLKERKNTMKRSPVEGVRLPSAPNKF